MFNQYIMEVSAEDLIERIFQKLPENPNSIQLSFVDQLDSKDLYEFLLTFFTEGCKIRYGNHENRVNLSKFTDKEFEKMNDYCKSIGFKLKIDRYDLGDANVINFDLLDYRKQNFNPDTPIKEFKLPIKCTDDIFVISFDFYTHTTNNYRCW